MASEKKDPAAVALGRRGGKNSRKYLGDEEKTELAQKAARARWGNKPKKAAAKKRPGRKS